ncbi:MAG: hypothetical protein ACREDE_03420 [Thermoplasmata archaeon]
MQRAPNAAVRRFRWVQVASVAVKLAALGGILLFLAIYAGGLK